MRRLSAVIGLIFGIILVSYSSSEAQVYRYDTDTHNTFIEACLKYMTTHDEDNKPINGPNNKPLLLCLPRDSQDQILFNESDIRNALILGSNYENFPYFRVFHFYDYVNHSGFPGLDYNAYEWASESIFKIDDIGIKIPGTDIDYTIPIVITNTNCILIEAISQFYQGNYQSAYRILGGIMNVLQDMGSPAYVRGDPSGLIGMNYYEKWCTQKNLSSIPGNFKVDLDEIDFAKKDLLKTFFDKLSNVTGSNFLSDWTIQSAPLDQNRTITPEEGVTYYINNIDPQKDKCSYIARRIGAENIGNESQGLNYNIAVIDDKVNKDTWQYISPNVVKYSIYLMLLFQDKCFPKSFIKISDRTFIMGSPDDKGKSDEHPEHYVDLSTYWIGRYEVTNRQFAQFINDSDYEPEGDWRHYPGSSPDYPDSYLKYPVINVSWNDAKAFCDWMNTIDDNFIYSLPTEAQWEKAASGRAIIDFPYGNDFYPYKMYPWGNDWTYNQRNNCNNMSGPALSGMLNLYGGRGTVKVGLFDGHHSLTEDGASHYGVMDMAGNVCEWCSDCYDKNYYDYCHQFDPIKDPMGPEGGHGKVLRGGGWGGTDNVNGSRCAARSSAQPGLWDTGIGFRCVRKLR